MAKYLGEEGLKQLLNLIKNNGGGYNLIHEVNNSIYFGSVLGLYDTCNDIYFNGESIISLIEDKQDKLKYLTERSYISKFGGGSEEMPKIEYDDSKHQLYITGAGCTLNFNNGNTVTFDCCYETGDVGDIYVNLPMNVEGSYDFTYGGCKVVAVPTSISASYTGNSVSGKINVTVSPSNACKGVIFYPITDQTTYTVDPEGNYVNNTVVVIMNYTIRVYSAVDQSVYTDVILNSEQPVPDPDTPDEPEGPDEPGEPEESN